MNSYNKSKIPGLGGKGEDIAANYLANNGYKILDRNFRTKYGEIDIICKDKTETLVFVEVKTFAGSINPLNSLLPEDNLSAFKIYKLKRIITFFINKYPSLTNKNVCQLDLIAIELSWRRCRLRHYRNI